MTNIQDHLIIKKCLRIIAEKFFYQLNYLDNKVILSKESDRIEIELLLKGNYKIDYKRDDVVKSINVNPENLFDIYLQFLSSQKKSNIGLHDGENITQEVWTREEQITSKEIQQILDRITEKSLDQYQFRGNRIIAEYYKGLIICTDDIGYYKSNVFITQ